MSEPTPEEQEFHKSLFPPMNLSPGAINALYGEDYVLSLKDRIYHLQQRLQLFQGLFWVALLAVALESAMVLVMTR